MKSYIDILPKTKGCATCEFWIQVGVVTGMCKKMNYKDKCSYQGKRCKKYELRTTPREE